MANEVTIVSSLRIVTGNLIYQSQPTAFSAAMTGSKGPTPGAISVPIGGVAVTFGELITPGFCRLMNLDATNYVEYGIRDPGINVFYPLGEILPGESFILRLSRNLLEEYTGTGTGTTSTGNQFWLKANTATCYIVVEAFEK